MYVLHSYESIYLVYSTCIKHRHILKPKVLSNKLYVCICQYIVYATNSVILLETLFLFILFSVKVA